MHIYSCCKKRICIFTRRQFQRFNLQIDLESAEQIDFPDGTKYAPQMFSDIKNTFYGTFSERQQKIIEMNE
jgi:hypothetical protein